MAHSALPQRGAYFPSRMGAMGEGADPGSMKDGLFGCFGRCRFLCFAV